MTLEIVLITYNRADFLAKSLGYLSNSCIKDHKVSVLDNHSTDNSREVVESFKDKFTNLAFISNKINIGLGGNVMRAFEISSSDYTWILCDDDYIDIGDFSDIKEKIQEARMDLIHVGAHPVSAWSFGGQTATARDLVLNGYPFFKFSSFLPCNIFRTKKFQENFMIKGYGNIVNAYPHMPYLFDIYETNSLVYISRKQIVTARVEGQSYDASNWVIWWIETCKLLSDKETVLIAFFDQFDSLNRTIAISNVVSWYWDDPIAGKRVRVFFKKYLNPRDQGRVKMILSKRFLRKVYYKSLHILQSFGKGKKKS